MTQFYQGCRQTPRNLYWHKLELVLDEVAIESLQWLFGYDFGSQQNYRHRFCSKPAKKAGFELFYFMQSIDWQFIAFLGQAPFSKIELNQLTARGSRIHSF